MATVPLSSQKKNCLLKVEQEQVSQPHAVLNRLDALQTALRLLTGCMLDERYKALHNIDLYENVDANVLDLDAKKKCNIFASGLPIFLTDFSATSGVIFQLLLSTVSWGSVAILDGNGIVAEEVVNSFENMPVDVIV